MFEGPAEMRGFLFFFWGITPIVKRLHRFKARIFADDFDEADANIYTFTFNNQTL